MSRKNGQDSYLRVGGSLFISFCKKNVHVYFIEIYKLIQVSLDNVLKRPKFVNDEQIYLFK